MEYQKKTLKKLSEYLGKERAMEYIKKEKYNYQAVSTKLLLLNLKEYSKRKPLVFWGVIMVLLLLLAIYVFDTLYF